MDREVWYATRMGYARHVLLTHRRRRRSRRSRLPRGDGGGELRLRGRARVLASLVAHLRLPELVEDAQP